MTERIFFLSHNKEDKPVVRQVAERLGTDICWLDEGEIRAGESILEKVDRGIADSRIFVLFWSSYSRESAWVREETSQARIRALRDGGFRLVPVKLDETELPNYLAYRLCLDIKKGLDFVVEALRETARDLTPPEVFVGSSELKDSFQDREREMDRLEQVSFSGEYSGALVLGLSGMGKTALVRRATARLFPHLTPVWADVDVARSPIRFLSTLARPLSIAIEPESAAANPAALWRDRILPEIAQSRSLFVVLDNFTGTPGEFMRGHAMNSLLRAVATDLSKITKDESPGLIVIASSQPDLDAQTVARLGTISVRALRRKDMVRALRYQLRHISGAMAYDSEDLTRLAEVLHGYPLALGLAASQIAERGLELVMSDLEGLHGLVIQLAQELVSRIPLDEEEKSALISLATAKRPLGNSLAKALLGERFRIVDNLIGKQFLDLSGPGYALHGILQDYVLESMASPEQIREAHSKLSDIFRRQWERAPDLSAACAEFGSLAYFHTIAAGQEADASAIKFAYREEAKEAGIELYRRGDYETALAYLENLREMETESEPVVEFYYALSLNRTGRSADALPIVESLAKQDSSVPRYHHAMGSILRRLRRQPEALKAFRKAVATSRRRDVVALSSLAAQLCDMRQAEKALVYAKEAYAKKPGDSQVISVLARAYHETGQESTALEILDRALRRRPTDTRLHARAGIIAKGMGDLLKAREHLTRASSDPSLLHAITALADVYVQLDDFDRARKVLESYPRDRHPEASYYSTKANILRHEARFSDALDCIQQALRLEASNPVHHGGSAQLHMDMAQQALTKGDLEDARLHVEIARDDLNRGLGLDPTSQPLLSIQEKLGRLAGALL